MAEILNKYKRWKPRLIMNRMKELDFVLSQDNSLTIDLDSNLTDKCLISYIDTNIKECLDELGNAVSLSGYTYENYINEGAVLPDFGFTGVDNGRVTYEKDETTLEDFINIITGSTLTIESNDPRLHLYAVNGNSKYYNYPVELVSELSGDTYYAMKGGFLQGFYKMFNVDYEVLPKDIVDCWNLEFVIRPRTDYVETGLTLNMEHPENKGTFFYMGTRSENKFGRFYGEDLSKYPDRRSWSGDCFDECEKPESGSTVIDNWRGFVYGIYFGQPTEKNLCNCKCGLCKELSEKQIEELVSSLTTCSISLSTSEGHDLDSNKYFEITTDNKYLIFDRTKEGYNVKTWEEGDVLTIIQQQLINHENLYLLMNRTCSGYTVKTIDKYFDTLTGQSEDYSILTDIKDNAFALKINEDYSIGYKYLIKDCDSESGYSVKEEHTFANIINPDEWNVVNVMFKIQNGGTDKCGNSMGNRLMRIFIYVNGYLKLVSKELPEFRFRELNDFYDKQEGVPFNISLGGGTQGLAESMWTDNYTRPYCKVLPIEENFGGTFIGDIRSFKFYDCQLQYNEIKNNYLYEMNMTTGCKPKPSIIDENTIYYGFDIDYTQIPIRGSKMPMTKEIRSKFIAKSNYDDAHFYVIIPKKCGGLKPCQFTCGGAPMVMNSRSEAIYGVECTVYESGEIYAPGTELLILSDNL